MTAHRCAGGFKKKLDLRSGPQSHKHFVGFFNVPVLAPTRDQPLKRWFQGTAPLSRVLQSRRGYGGAHSRLNPPPPRPSRGCFIEKHAGKQNQRKLTLRVQCHASWLTQSGIYDDISVVTIIRDSFNFRWSTCWRPIHKSTKWPKIEIINGIIRTPNSEDQHSVGSYWFSFSYFKRTRQIIRYRATATLRRPQNKQYSASK